MAAKRVTIVEPAERYYSDSMNELMTALKHAEKSSSTTCKHLDEAETFLLESTTDVIVQIEKRCEELYERFRGIVEEQKDVFINMAIEAQEMAQKPLQEKKEENQRQSEEISTLMQKGEAALDGQAVTKAFIKESKNKVSRYNYVLEDTRTDIPAVSFNTDTFAQLEHVLKCDVNIGLAVPVKVSDLLPRPGAILVKWSEYSEDVDLTGAMFRLECQDTRTNDAPFSVRYEGSLKSAVVHDLIPHTTYAFRVSCSLSPDVWSLQSFVRKGATHLNAHAWDQPPFTVVDGEVGSPLYELQLCDRKLTTLSHKHIHVSSAAPSYLAGHEISFAIYSSPVTTSSLTRAPLGGFGLAVDADAKPMDENCLFIDASGAVFINGSEMRTRLPELKADQTLNISTQYVSEETLRATIEVDDKQVICDWKVTATCLPQEDNCVTHANTVGEPILGCHLNHSKGRDYNNPVGGKEPFRFYAIGAFDAMGWRVKIK